MNLYVDIEKELENTCIKAKFEIGVGEVLSVFGASGSGKSMLLKCIAGIETPDCGCIRFGDQVFFDSKRKINLKPQQRKIGYAFQHFALFPNMTVEENIGISIPRTERKQKVAEYIKNYNLDGLEKLYPKQLSGGQKQRVSIARMFASDPNVFLLDEPFSALERQLAWELVYEMKRTLERLNCPVIFVSHNKEEVYQLSSKVAIMEDGTLGTIRDTKDMFSYPKTVQEAYLCGYENLFWLKDGDFLDITRVPSEEIRAICFDAKAVKFETHHKDDIAFSAIFDQEVEELQFVRYEFLLVSNAQKRVYMRVNKVDRKCLRVGESVQLFLCASDIYHLS